MAANASAVWRVRPSGNNNNGGGFDCAISSAATGSHGSWTTSAGTTTFTDATAAAFTTGMVNSAINISGVGQFTILSRVDANNVTITTMPPWLPANSNFGSAANWTVGSGTDYSQQNSAQVTQSSTANTSTSTTTLTDTGASFTAALIGNGIRVAGTGITTTFTYITAVPSGTTLTLQTSPGTTGTSVSYNIGGGWADPQTNTTSGAGVVQPGNTVYILGGASPSYVSPDYTYSGSNIQPTSGTSTAGLVVFSGDPATPTTNGFSGYPLIKHNGGIDFNSCSLVLVANMFIFGGAGSNSVSNGTVSFKNVVLDQNGYDFGLGTSNFVHNVEGFSSAAKRTSNGSYLCTCTSDRGGIVFGCNFHDGIGPGINGDNGFHVNFTIVAKNGSDGINAAATNSSTTRVTITNCTIDGNAGHGIVLSQNALANAEITNNILSNHATAGKYAITVAAGTQAVNDRIRCNVDYNSLYNNAGNYNAISPGAHDTVLSSNPYVGQSTENYTLA